jgi:hypothetical protein
MGFPQAVFPGRKMDRLPVSISGQTVVTKIHPQIQKTLKIKDFSFGHKNDHFGERRIPEIAVFMGVFGFGHHFLPSESKWSQKSFFGL